MIGADAILVSGYAGHANWDWRIAVSLGVLAGIWNFAMRAGLKAVPWLAQHFRPMIMGLVFLKRRAHQCWLHPPAVGLIALPRSPLVSSW